jgi:hypothetical protein
MMRPSNLKHPSPVRPRTSQIVPALIPRENGSQRGPAPRVAQSRQIGVRLLDLAAAIGLSLLITAGFAAALSLYTNLSPSSPHVIDVCEGIFLWSLALFSCVTSSRS